MISQDAKSAAPSQWQVGKNAGRLRENIFMVAGEISGITAKMYA
jgi:hypothetical protein